MPFTARAARTASSIITTKRGQSGKPSVELSSASATQTLANKYNMRCFTFDQAQAEAQADFGITLTPADYAGCVDPQEVIYGNHFLSYETGAVDSRRHAEHDHVLRFGGLSSTTAAWRSTPATASSRSA